MQANNRNNANMHPVQQAYLEAIEEAKAAKKRFEELVEKHKDQIEQLEETGTEAEEDNFYIWLDRQAGYSRSWDALLEATENLVKWAYDVIKKRPEYRKDDLSRKLLDDLFQNRKRLTGEKRDRFFDLCLKL